ncbi:MAG: RNA polymerase sigma factor [Hespellia sp.]|nr:RNA polymerase sigma factor [Hespellia sp.]
MDSDFLLIRRMKQGEESAFDVFVHKYYKEILSYCGYRCPDRGYAEDIAQETFLRFFAKLSAYRYKGKTKNYLYTIAGNLCKDYLKKIKESPTEETKLSKIIGFEERQTERALDKLAVGQALKQLSDEFREVIILYYFQELRLREIADILEISLPLVKYRLKQARMQLLKLL